MNFINRVKKSLKEQRVRLTAIGAAIAVLGSGAASSIVLNRNANNENEKTIEAQNLINHMHIEDELENLEVNIGEETYSYNENITKETTSVENAIYEAKKKQENLKKKTINKNEKRTGVNIGDYNGVSIEDALRQAGYSISVEYRSNLAEQYGIENYNTSAEKNTELLNALKKEAKEIKAETQKNKTEQEKKKHKHNFKLVDKVFKKNKEDKSKHTVVKTYECKTCDKEKTVEIQKDHKFSKFTALNNLIEKAVCKKCGLTKFRFHRYVKVLDKDGIVSFKCSHKSCGNIIIGKKQQPNVKPTNPTTPSTPSTPTDTTEPSEATKASAPSTSTDTTKPSEVTKPSTPSTPTDTTKPSEATKPSIPSTSTDTTKPSEVTKPSTPSTPTDTTKPSEATKPSIPSTPTDTTKPSEATKPSAPSTPTDTTKPSEPEYTWVEDGKPYCVKNDDETHSLIQKYKRSDDESITKTEVISTEEHKFSDMFDKINDNNKEEYPCLDDCGYVKEVAHLHDYTYKVVLDKYPLDANDYCRKPEGTCQCGKTQDLTGPEYEQYYLEHNWKSSSKHPDKEVCVNSNCYISRDKEIEYTWEKDGEPYYVKNDDETHSLIQKYKRSDDETITKTEVISTEKHRISDVFDKVNDNNKEEYPCLDGCGYVKEVAHLHDYTYKVVLDKYPLDANDYCRKPEGTCQCGKTQDLTGPEYEQYYLEHNWKSSSKHPDKEVCTNMNCYISRDKEIEETTTTPVEKILPVREETVEVVSGGAIVSENTMSSQENGLEMAIDAYLNNLSHYSEDIIYEEKKYLKRK